MGSFDATCAVSHLPIHCGTKVKAFLVTENPFKDNVECYIHDQWIPRTFAIDAEYNDYGSIQKYAMDALTKVWSEGLRNDLIEVGTGDNQCHDVSTDKNMKFEALLEALWEQRVLVSQNYNRHPDEPKREYSKESLAEMEEAKKKDYSKDGHISLQKARKLLENFKGLLIDRLPFGPIRVRIAGYGEKTVDLETVLPYFQPDYQAFIVAGSGDYSHAGEVWVVNKPNTKEHTTSAHSTDSIKNKLLVRLSLIRKDVWDELVSNKKQTYDESYKTVYLNLKDELAKVKKVWDVDFEYDNDYVLPKNASPAEISEYFDKKYSKYDTRRQHVFTNNEAVLSLGYHWDRMVRAAQQKKLSAKEIEAFQLSAAEMSMAWSAMSNLRVAFRPFYTAGPQFGDYKAHAKFNKALGKIAADIYKKQKEDRGE